MQEARWWSPVRGAVVVALAMLTACGSGEEATLDVGPSAPRAREDAETLTTDLAPSQVTASTVTRPDTPPPCEPDAVTMWTGSVDIGDDRATAILRVRNDGPVWCEIDLRESPRIDPRTEPDLWLEPGEWGELWVGADERSTCDEPTAVLMAEIAVLDQVRSVPTAAVVPCDWAILALFGADAPETACDPVVLAAVRAGDELVVRNTSFTPCLLGELIDIVGLDGDVRDVRTEPPPVEVLALAGGDTVSFTIVPGTTGCAPAAVTARFDTEIELVVGGLESCDSVLLGPGRPFYDGPEGPLAGLSSPLDESGVVAALTALDPFAER